MSDDSQPTRKPPFVVERILDHPSGQSQARYLAPGGSVVPPRWVPFLDAKRYQTEREADAAMNLVALDDDEPIQLRVREWWEVYQERDIRPERPGIKKVVQDFYDAERDDPWNRTRLELIGLARIQEKEASKERHPTSQDGDWQVLRPSSTLTVSQILEGRGGMGIA